MKRLTQDTPATFLHGVTGQEIDIGELAAGTLVRNIRTTVAWDGEVVTAFHASTDGGRAWYLQRVWGVIKTEEVVAP